MKVSPSDLMGPEPSLASLCLVDCGVGPTVQCFLARDTDLWAPKAIRCGREPPRFTEASTAQNDVGHAVRSAIK